MNIDDDSGQKRRNFVSLIFYGEVERQRVVPDFTQVEYLQRQSRDVGDVVDHDRGVERVHRKDQDN